MTDPDFTAIADKIERIQDAKGTSIICLQFETLSEVVHALRHAIPTPVAVARPWGSYEILDVGVQYQVKRLVVNVGARLSLQSHAQRSEHWVVVRGLARVICDTGKFGASMPLGPNESIYIPTGAKHRLTNVGDCPLIVIETQIGSYLGEDDIVRYDDDYQRLS